MRDLRNSIHQTQKCDMKRAIPNATSNIMKRDYQNETKSHHTKQWSVIKMWYTRCKIVAKRMTPQIPEILHQNLLKNPMTTCPASGGSSSATKWAKKLQWNRQWHARKKAPRRSWKGSTNMTSEYKTAPSTKLVKCTLNGARFAK